MTTDFYAQGAETSEGRVFTVTGQDWDEITRGIARPGEHCADERVDAVRRRPTTGPGQRHRAQRKDYPLGGIPVEYKGGTIPPPDQRRSYN